MIASLLIRYTPVPPCGLVEEKTSPTDVAHWQMTMYLSAHVLLFSGFISSQSMRSEL